MHCVLRHSVVRRLSYPQLQQCRNNATDATTYATTAKSRIASDFNGLVIPSRQELLSQKSTLNDGSSRAQSPVGRRHDPTIEQRRAQRLAREAAKAARVQTPSSEDVPRTQRQNGESGARSQQRGRPAATRAKAIHRDWHVDVDALGQFETKRSNSSPRDTRGGGRPQRTAGSFSASQRMKSRTRGGGSGGSGSRAAVKSRPTTSSKSGKASSKYDISSNVIEGGEEPNGAEIIVPEGLSVDLADVFGQIPFNPHPVSALQQKRPATAKPPSLAKYHTKYIVETFGGDYTRYSPRATRDYLTNPREVNAVKLAQLALSKNKGVDLNQREKLLKIINATATVSDKEVSRA